MFKIIFLGDVFGRPGREILRDLLPALISQKNPHLVIANGENASGGLARKPEAAQELFNYGVDFITGGNHTFKFKEIIKDLESDQRLLRPANYPEPCPGRGWTVAETSLNIKVGLGNLMGRIYMREGLDCPFKAADSMIQAMKEAGAQIILIDFHAEATSEKRALGWYLDGRISALVGTHTHIPTADAQILPQKTAFQTDAGMCGPHQSVIGMRTAEILAGFLSGRPQRFEPAKKGVQLNGVYLEINPQNGQAQAIEPLIICP